MASKDGTPVDVPPAARRALAHALDPERPRGPHVLLGPPGPPFGTAQLCGRCNLRIPKNLAPTHDCSHGNPCRYVYEDVRGGQKAVAIECSACDAAAR